MWKHDTRPATFALTVDDFGVKCVGKEHAEHLRDALKEHYEITEDWEGKLFSGINMDWDYESNPRKVDLDMEGYVPKALEKLGHPKPKKPQHAPAPYNAPTYGKQTQEGMKPREHTLTVKEEPRLQKATGLFLCYARTMDEMMLCTLIGCACISKKGFLACMPI